MTDGSGLPGTAADGYRERHDRFDTARKDVQGTSQRLANARLGAFIALVFWLVASDWRGWPVGVTAPPAVAVLSLFAWLVVRHARIKRRLDRLEALVAVNLEGMARQTRTWDDLPPGEFDGVAPDHAYAHDLDLFGHASLFQLLGTVRTEVGRRTLADWLLAPAGTDSIKARQEAVSELAPLIGFRQELEIAGRRTGRVGRESVARFLEWADTPPWLPSHRWLLWYARIIPFLCGTAIVAFLAGAVGLSVAFLPILVNAAVTLTAGRGIHDLFFRAGADEASFQAYADVVALIGAQDFRSPLLNRVHEDLTAGGAAHRELARLHQLLILADMRLSMVYPVLQGLVLWDVHLLHRLERWCHRNGRRVGGWLRGVGDVEALAGLAALAHDQPDWCVPAVGPADRPRIHGVAVGHPLLADAVRVANDVDVGPPGTFLLVTGSNMSGKSTLLRALGLNVVLALAGGPVCARRFAIPELRVWTSMRVQDSLDDGVSYFLASLQRLKRVVDAARVAGQQPLLYLLDEILQGTNSAERMVAVRRVIAELLTRAAIGAVTTHDLELATTPELSSAAVQVHFRESIVVQDGVEQMTFDYTLRPGVATSTNALRLMHMIGLDAGG